MTRAEEAALKAYPEELTTAYGPLPGASAPCIFDGNRPYRIGFKRGYEAAEKDLAPIVQTAICLYESWQGGTMDEVRRYIVELGHLVQPIRKGGYND